MLISDKSCGKCFQYCGHKIQFKCWSGATTPFLCLNCWWCSFLQDIFIRLGADQIYPSGMKAFVSAHLLDGHFQCTHSIYSSYKIFWGYCGSPLRKPAHPSDQTGAGMQPEHLVILVCHTCYMWWPRMVAWRLISKAEQNETAFPLSSVHFLWSARCQN